jgi:hypothetical protein
VDQYPIRVAPTRGPYFVPRSSALLDEWPS